jgi:hypothetical protein
MCCKYDRKHGYCGAYFGPDEKMWGEMGVIFCLVLGNRKPGFGHSQPFTHTANPSRTWFQRRPIFCQSRPLTLLHAIHFHIQLESFLNPNEFHLIPLILSPFIYAVFLAVDPP